MRTLFIRVGRATLYTTTLVVWTAATASSAPMTRTPIGALTAQADLVITGTVTGTALVAQTTMDTPSGRVGARLMSAAFVADKVLAGNLATQLEQFEFVEPEQNIGYAPLPLNRYSVWFLKRTADGWAILKDDTPCAIASPRFNAKGLAPLDAVATSIAAVVRSPTASTADKTEALITLSFISNSVALEGIRAGASDTNALVRYRAVAMLLGTNHVEGLSLAESALTHPDQVPPIAIIWLVPAMARGITDPAAVPFLARIAKSTDVRVRRAALEALGRTKSRTAIDGLATALTDSDADVQWLAVKGLSEILAVRGHCSTKEQFEAGFGGPDVAYWTAWIQTNGIKQ